MPARLAALPRLEHWKVVQQLQPGVGDKPPGLEVPQVALATERVDRAVARRRAEQVYALDLIAAGQVGDACVADAALPAHLEAPELGQLSQHLTPVNCPGRRQCEGYAAIASSAGSSASVST